LKRRVKELEHELALGSHNDTRQLAAANPWVELGGQLPLTVSEPSALSNTSSKSTSWSDVPASGVVDEEGAVDTLATGAFSHFQETDIGHFGKVNIKIPHLTIIEMEIDNLN
jgi:hypothetical protein